MQFSSIIVFALVGVAQLVERRVVVSEVVGSIPIAHPKLFLCGIQYVVVAFNWWVQSGLPYYSMLYVLGNHTILNRIQRLVNAWEYCLLSIWHIITLKKVLPVNGL